MTDSGSQKQSGGETAANPMAMVKKMMAGMGQGGPMEMMQKMMGQMAKSGGKQALGGQATPELQELFGEWLTATEDKVLDLIAKNTTDTAAIAAALKLSEASVIYLLTRLAQAGKITLKRRSQSRRGAPCGGGTDMGRDLGCSDPS